ncbi:type II secretion system F family protein [Lichenicoccus sp.]|uniref:type II secretion system F family protein n=1 Tax=Lichenicoccus sp. TaxID=2781899 RepID=UPI003D0CAEA3
MNPTLLIGIGGMTLFLVPLCAIPIMTLLRRRKRLKQRLLAVRQTDGIVADTGVTRAKAPPLVASVASLGFAVVRTGLLSKRTLTELEQTLQAGGFRGGSGLGLFVGSKMLLVVILPVIAFVLLGHVHMRPILHIGAVGAAAVIGLLSPDYVIRNMRQKYLKAVERGLADALDMMIICAEAGLALEAAIRRVGIEIVHAHPKLAEELSITSGELNMISDSRVALTNMGARTGLVSLRRLGGTLVQTIQYGTPLSVALRTLATELRQETLTRYEEKAARLPVLLTVPMILFILPCVFLIVAGPIAVQVIQKFRH